ncbi:hypothetical protein SAMN06295967_1012 [Belliella buryatensis]|uniref:TolB-like 6-blade propeller-like n=1 Tax=Belliella buryatensis TaxID=1500549 RepID=A0A239AAG0_9BACT|nr:hypothetical protein [Belliella buryatensis]SNR92646.1 hypothetical protein SAMN06295967_1012 [Belliella buryatensis]
MKISENCSYLLALLLLAACGKSEESTRTASEPSYELIKVDSFQVENLTRVRITDFSETENIYLGYSEAENDVLEISPEGNIIKRVNLSGDGPGKLGNWVPLGLSFGPEQKRVFQLPFQLATYNQNYEQIENIRIQSPLPVRTSFPLSKTAYFMEDGNPRYLVGPTSFLSAHLLIYDEVGRDTLQNFSLLYPESGDMKSIIPYEADSYYKKTPNIYTNLMAKSFFISSDKLHVLQGLSESIQVYDLKEFNLIKNIPLTHSEFLKYDPVPIGTSMDDPRVNQLSSMAGRNLRIFDLSDELWLVRYFQGITNSEFELRNSEENPFRFVDANDKIKLIVFKNGEQIPGELEVPEGTMLFSLGKNKVLVEEKPSEDIEEEFTRYSVYELRIIN